MFLTSEQWDVAGYAFYKVLLCTAVVVAVVFGFWLVAVFVQSERIVEFAIDVGIVFKILVCHLVAVLVEEVENVDDVFGLLLV